MSLSAQHRFLSGSLPMLEVGCVRSKQGWQPGCLGLQMQMGRG